MKDLEMTNNEKTEFLYDVVAGVMAVIAVIIVIMELSSRFNGNEIKIIKACDNIIYIIFVIDYIFRFIASKDKRNYFKNNLIDVIAILPYQFIPTIEYGSIFKLIRVATYILRLFGNITEILFTNGLIYVTTLVFIIDILGAVGIFLFENKTNEKIKNYGDALWFSVVTLTGVGYGDIEIKSSGGRVIAVILMFTGLIFLGIVTSTIATFYMSKVDKKVLTNYEMDEDASKLNYLDISSLSVSQKEKLLKYYDYLKTSKK